MICDILTSRLIDNSDRHIREFSYNGRHFEFYNRGWWSRTFEYAWMIDAAQAHFASITNKTAIDIATGDCHPGALILQSLGFKTTGTDLYAPSKFPYPESGITYITDDIVYSQLNEQYDCVCCISVLEHISHNYQEQALHNILKRVRPGGCAILTFDSPGYDSVTDIELYHKVVNDIGFTTTRDQSNDPIRSSKLPTSHDVQSLDLKCYRLFAANLNS